MTRIAENNRRIAKNTVFLYFRSLFLLLINLYTSRITLQVLGVDDYGIYQVVGGVVAMFSMLSSTLASASQRFITYSLGRNDKMHLKGVFSTCITLHIILGLIIVILLEIFGIWFLDNELNIPPERIRTAAWVMHFSIATFFISVISLPFNALIIAYEKMNVFAYISILEGMLKLGAVFLLMILEWDKLLIYAVLHFLIAVLLRIIYSAYSRNKFEEAQNIKMAIDKTLFKDMFSFAGWNLFGHGTLVIRNQGVDIIINMFFGVVVNAAKGISNQVQAAVFQLVGNFTTALKPQLTKAIAQNNYRRTVQLINTGTRYIFLMMAILSIPIMACASGILDFWLGNVPHYAAPFVQWTMVYLLIDSFSRLLIHSILSQGDIRVSQIVVGCTKLLTVPLLFICFRFSVNPLWGIWINILLEVVCLIERLYFNAKQLNIDCLLFFRKVITRCLLVFVLAYPACYFSVEFFVGNLFLGLIISFSITGLIICVFGVTHEELKFLYDILQKTTIRMRQLLC